MCPGMLWYYMQIELFQALLYSMDLVWCLMHVLSPEESEPMSLCVAKDYKSKLQINLIEALFFPLIILLWYSYGCF